MTYFVRYEFWVAGGLTKVLQYIVVSGSLVALLAALIVPAGYWLGLNGCVRMERHPRWAFSGPLVVLVALWTLVRVVQ